MASANSSHPALLALSLTRLKLLFSPLLITVLVLVMTACGGGSSSTDASTEVPQDDPVQQNNTPPIVVIGSEASVQVGKQIAVSAAVSDDGLPSNSLTYQWQKDTGPGSVLSDNYSVSHYIELKVLYVCSLPQSRDTLVVRASLTLCLQSFISVQG